MASPQTRGYGTAWPPACVAAGCAAVTIDLRGHGRSSKPDGPYDVPTVADDLAALIGALGLDRPVVAGQSWGGNVVLELAARHPAAIRGIAWWTAAGSSCPCLPRLGDLPCRARARLAWRAGCCRDGGLCPVGPCRLARDRHPGHARQLRDPADGTIAPWLTYDRHLAVLRGLWEHHPAARYRAVKVAGPADPGRRRRRTTGPTANAGGRAARGASRTRGPSG